MPAPCPLIRPRSRSRPRVRLLAWLPLLAGPVLALLLLELARGTVLIKLEGAAFGRDTSAFERPGSQCSDAADSATCLTVAIAIVFVMLEVKSAFIYFQF